MLGEKSPSGNHVFFLIMFLHQVVRSVSSPFNFKLSSLISLVSYLHGNQLLLETALLLGGEKLLALSHMQSWLLNF